MRYGHDQQFNTTLAALRTCSAEFAEDLRGGVALIFGFMMPVLVAMAGTAADYASMGTQRAKLQAVADSAALAAAREFRLGNVNDSTLHQAVHSHARGSLASQELIATVTPSVDLKGRTVSVALRSEVQTYVMGFLTPSFSRLDVRATAKMVGGAPVCVVGLDQNSLFSVGLDKNAKLDAPGCAIYSNSRSPFGLFARNRATMRAAFICSAGGREFNGPGSYAPTPQQDCPVLRDPLEQRSLPTTGVCRATNLVVSGRSTTLSPGTYCGGISVTQGATVRFEPGEYIMRNGPLHVEQNGSIIGTNVGIHLSGNGAVLNFEAASNISLTAPKLGTMAGILFSEDRLSPIWQFHRIMSNNARMLLGTIYLSRGSLLIGASAPIADQSAYTIVVVRQFILTEGPTMVLNSNYGATDVPVPDGVGPNASKAVLAN